MPIVQAKCTNCGGILQINNEKDAAICPYCQTPYIVEKAISNYQVSIKDSAVNIYTTGLSYDDKYESANSFLTVHKDYVQAEKIFEDLVKTNPNDYRGWWGVVRTKTKEFTDLELYPQFVNGLDGDVQSSLRVCSDERLQSDIKNTWESYKTIHKQKWDARTEAERSLKKLENERDKTRQMISIYAKSAKGNFIVNGVGWGIIVLAMIFIVPGIIGAVAYDETDLLQIGVIAPLLSVAFVGIIILWIGKKSKKDSIKKLRSLESELQETEKKISDIQQYIKGLFA